MFLAAGVAACGGSDGSGASDAGAGSVADEWTAPVTPWGDPDLRGMWPLDYINGTPVQRPKLSPSLPSLACHRACQEGGRRLDLLRLRGVSRQVLRAPPTRRRASRAIGGAVSKRGSSCFVTALSPLYSRL